MIKPEEMYAVVWHESGRIDCEPLQMMIDKNRMEVKPGAVPKRALLDVTETIVQAGTKAHEWRIKLRDNAEQT